MDASTHDFMLGPFVMHILDILDGIIGICRIVMKAKEVRGIICHERHELFDPLSTIIILMKRLTLLIINIEG